MAEVIEYVVHEIRVSGLKTRVESYLLRPFHRRFWSLIAVRAKADFTLQKGRSDRQYYAPLRDAIHKFLYDKHIQPQQICPVPACHQNDTIRSILTPRS